MEEIHIKIGENNLFVKGKYTEEEKDERGYVIFPHSFEISSIECNEKDLSDLLEWANSQANGHVLEIIEELVLENRV